MKRRNFTQSLLIGAGLSSLPLGVSFAKTSLQKSLHSYEKINTSEGNVLKLHKKSNPTKNKDHKQFILTYDVENIHSPLEEKIYQVTLENGEEHSLFMSPIGEKQLQVVFNLRINA